MPGTIEATEQTQFLTFLLADESYAVSILRVREIIEYDTLTRVPSLRRPPRRGNLCREGPASGLRRPPHIAPTGPSTDSGSK